MTHTAKHTFTRRPLLFTLLSATLAIAACGGGGGGGGGSSSGSSGGGSGTGTPSTPPLVMETFAGHIGGEGNADGTGIFAAFENTVATVVDSAGYIYVAEGYTGRVRKISPEGAVTTLTKLSAARALAIDAAGNLYVSDGTKIFKVSASGAASVFVGSTSGNQDGTGTAAKFNNVVGLAFDSAGVLYASDDSDHTIRKITNTGVVSTLAGFANSSGSTNDSLDPTKARFNSPQGLAADRDGNIYVADKGNNVIRKIAPTGAVTTVAGKAGVYGTTEGIGDAALFGQPTGILVDASGNLIVTDQWGSNVRKIASNGQTSTFAARYSGDANGYIESPRGISKDVAGNLFLASNGYTVLKITTAGAVTTLAGKIRRSGDDDGTLSTAKFGGPRGMVSDAANNLYVADTGNNHNIRKISATGNVTTWAGNTWGFGGADGLGSAASFYAPTGMAKDAAGNLYVSDQNGHTIRKINSDGLVTTLAGTYGATGTVNGTGAIARFNQPSGIAVDRLGNVYVADTSNYAVRKVTTSGEVSTLAGKPGVSGTTNGIGEAARFTALSGLVIDSQGNLFVADRSNNTIRKIVTRTGEVSTFAGGGGGGKEKPKAMPDTTNSASDDGMATAARFDNPSTISIDAKDNLYVFDSGSYTVRKITPAGLVSTLVGKKGMRGYQPGKPPGALQSEASLLVVGSDLYIAMSNGIAVVRNLP